MNYYSDSSPNRSWKPTPRPANSWPARTSSASTAVKPYLAFAVLADRASPARDASMNTPEAAGLIADQEAAKTGENAFPSVVRQEARTFQSPHVDAREASGATFARTVSLSNFSNWNTHLLSEIGVGTCAANPCPRNSFCVDSQISGYKCTSKANWLYQCVEQVALDLARFNDPEVSLSRVKVGSGRCRLTVGEASPCDPCHVKQTGNNNEFSLGASCEVVICRTSDQSWTIAFVAVIDRPQQPIKQIYRKNWRQTIYQE